jgi:hypothetical protein
MSLLWRERCNNPSRARSPVSRQNTGSSEANHHTVLIVIQAPDPEVDSRRKSDDGARDTGKLRLDDVGSRRNRRRIWTRVDNCPELCLFTLQGEKRGQDIGGIHCISLGRRIQTPAGVIANRGQE